MNRMIQVKNLSSNDLGKVFSCCFSRAAKFVATPNKFVLLDTAKKEEIYLTQDTYLFIKNKKIKGGKNE